MYELHLVCGDFMTVGRLSDVCITGVVNHGIQFREGFVTIDIQLDADVRAYCTTTDECCDKKIVWLERDEDIQHFLQRTMIVVDRDLNIHKFNVLAHKNDKHITIICGDKLDKIVKVERTTIYG